MVVADKESSLILSGNGDVLEPKDVMAIGSGGNYALAAARALYDTKLDAEKLQHKVLKLLQTCAFIQIIILLLRK